ncbi:MAG: DNA repair protein RecO, partial [Phycisphaeraceae bacterium]
EWGCRLGGSLARPSNPNPSGMSSVLQLPASDAHAPHVVAYPIGVPRFTDMAICIRDLDWSETSQLVVLLTQNHGKVRGLAKGSRRQSPSSVARFSGGINLLNLGQAIVTTKPATQLAAITEWDLRDDHHALRTALGAQWSAMYAADLTGAMLADEDPHPGAFAALLELLRACDKPADVPAALLRFQWRLLSDVGYRPELDHDVAVGGALGDARAYSFDPRLGGLTRRSALNDEAWRVRRETVELLRSIASQCDLAGRGRACEPPETERDDSSQGDSFRGVAEPPPRPPGTAPPTSERASADAITRANRLLCTYARALLDKELPTMQLILADQ